MNNQETADNARDHRAESRNMVVRGETSPNENQQQETLLNTNQQQETSPNDNQQPAAPEPVDATQHLLISLQQQISELKDASSNQQLLSELVTSLGIVANQAEDKAPGDTPTFNGDPLALEDFIEDVENQYTNQTKEGEKIMPNFLRGFSKLMKTEGGTKQSYKNFLQSHPPERLTWNGVKIFLRKEFKCAYARDEQWDKLWKLSMGISFRGYYQTFMASKEHLDDELCLTTTRKLFFNNLSEEFTQELLKKGYCSMEVLRETGLAYEQRITRKRKPNLSSKVVLTAKKTEHTSTNTVAQKKKKTDGKQESEKWKPLNEAQKEKLAEHMKGKCFGCGMTNHMKADCKVSEEKKATWRNEKKEWIKSMIEA